ncbi:hypothetical protein ACP4OV_008893 [Aristida adscensionis]
MMMIATAKLALLVAVVAAAAAAAAAAAGSSSSSSSSCTARAGADIKMPAVRESRRGSSERRGGGAGDPRVAAVSGLRRWAAGAARRRRGVRQLAARRGGAQQAGLDGAGAVRGVRRPLHARRLLPAGLPRRRRRGRRLRRVAQAIAGDGKEVWVFDIDETALSSLPYYATHGFGIRPFNATSFIEYVKLGTAPALPETQRLYKKLVSLGIRPVFLSGRPDSQRAVTAENLRRQGYSGWEKLLLKPAAGAKATAVAYKSGPDLLSTIIMKSNGPCWLCTPPPAGQATPYPPARVRFDGNKKLASDRSAACAPPNSPRRSPATPPDRLDRGATSPQLRRRPPPRTVSLGPRLSVLRMVGACRSPPPPICSCGAVDDLAVVINPAPTGGVAAAADLAAPPPSSMGGAATDLLPRAPTGGAAAVGAERCRRRGWRPWS